MAEKKTNKKIKKVGDLEAKIFDINGKESGTLKLPSEIFGLPWNSDMVHQVSVSMMSNMRSNIAHAKTRGEVRGGGRKPWQQKGTGRARHGSSRSPIWIGGGTTHGPRNEKNYSRKINKKMAQKAFLTVLSKKLKDGEVIFVNSLEFATPKTKEAIKVVKAIAKASKNETLATKRANAAVISAIAPALETQKSFRNIGSIELKRLDSVNILDILNSKYFVVSNPEESIKFLEKKIA